VPSASAVLENRRPIGQYHLYSIDRTGPGWRLALRLRRYSASSGQFEPAGEERLEVAAGASLAAAAVAGG
jgi:hypothetical protein